MDFDLDDDDDDEFDEVKELEELSTDERLIRVENKTKIVLILQIVGLILILFTLIVSVSNGKGEKKDSSNNGTSENTESGNNEYSTDSFIEITFGDIASRSKKEEIVVLLGRQGCYWCSLFAPLIGMEAIDNNFDLYYLDFGKIVDFSSTPAKISDNAAYEGLYSWIESSDYAESVAQGIGTPITFFVKNNKIVNMINGYTDQNNLESILKKEGFIK